MVTVSHGNSDHHSLHLHSDGALFAPFLGQNLAREKIRGEVSVKRVVVERWEGLQTQLKIQREAVKRRVHIKPECSGW